METPKALNADEKIFTAAEVAAFTKLHPATVREIFVNEPGVLRLGHPATRDRRRYFTLRIPASVLARVLGRMTVGHDRKPEVR